MQSSSHLRSASLVSCHNALDPAADHIGRDGKPVRVRFGGVSQVMRKAVSSVVSPATVVAALLAGAAMVGFETPSPVQAQPLDTSAPIRRAILNMRLPELKLDGASLSDSLEFIRDVTGANIHVNWRALEAAGISKDAVVNLRLRDVSVRRALTLLLTDAAGGNATLTYYMDDNIIEVTTKELADKQLFTRVFPVQDMVMEIPDFPASVNFDLSAMNTGSTSGGGGGGGSSSQQQNIFTQTADATEKVKTKAERGEELVQLIRDEVAPEVWRENGGPASIRYFNGFIVVTAPRSVIEAIGGATD